MKRTSMNFSDPNIVKGRILFVDDEIYVLKGLQRSLRGMRGEWEMLFVSNGEDALASMREIPCHVIVSDMRMPEMNGVELLEQVRMEFPDTVRIVLSGYSDQEMILRIIGPAHQYLVKPCETSMIINVIKRTLKLRSLLGSDDLRALVSSIDSLPSMPAVYVELINKLDDERASADSLTGIISRDIAMTAETLKLTNSAYFGLPTEVIDIRRAITFLGFDTIKSIALTAGIYGRKKVNRKMALTLDKLCQHSIGIGEMAKRIAQYEGSDDFIASQAGCAAALCHVGTLVLLTNWPDKFNEATRMVEDKIMSIYDAERLVFGSSHVELGAYLLGLWGFADPIVEAVVYHHEPMKSGYQEINLLTFVYIAQILPRIVKQVNKTDGANMVSILDMDYIRQIGADDKLNAWYDIVLELTEKEN
ncbi:MAG: response regulator [Desulfobulbaceae bacterium]|nr:response regulator [Desulfobulbaceae bacterium]